MVTPSLNDKGYSNVVRERKKLQEDPTSAKVTLLSEPPGVTTGTFSQSLRGNQSMFMRAQKKDNKISSEGKAIRLPRNDLLDLLFTLFESFEYWSLKGLKDRTKQPEVYLKEVLETMAVLIKKGPYAMRYTLKPEYKQIKENKNKEKKTGESLSEYMGKNGGAGIGGATQDGNAQGESNNIEDDDDDDEADIEMENVV